MSHSIHSGFEAPDRWAAGVEVANRSWHARSRIVRSVRTWEHAMPECRGVDQRGMDTGAVRTRFVTALTGVPR